MIPDISHALHSLAPGTEWVTDGEKVTLWLSPDIGQPTQAEIDTEITRLQAEYDAQAYARSRKAEYPTTDELVVALWEAVIEERMASSIELQGKRTAIKEKHPK
ncbi:MAG: hypothetical protein CL532_00555 [Aestuariivita sp.]|nr:hypothetical protein [Aestuariivita sp.]|tara:strand:+ start:368 stop:679 length:312 start_codon:yes stop_codon:yes gene_type:complete